MKGITLGLFFSLLLSIFIQATAAAADPTIYEIVKNEDKQTFSDMVMLGYDIDEKDSDGYTPLMIAAALGKAEFAEFLINNGANVNERSYKGLTAMHRAAQEGHTQIILLLSEADALIDIPDNEGFTPLMKAIMAEKFFAVDFLIKRGAALNFRNADGRTALWMSDHRRLSEISKLLRLKGGRY